MSWQQKCFKLISLSTQPQARFTVYTDASCEVVPPMTQPTVKLCYVLLGHHGSPNTGGYCTVPQEVLGSFADRETYIAHGEALAPLFALHNEPRLCYAVALWFIDNMGVLSSFCKGSSTVADFGCVIHVVLMIQAARKLATWWEHVDSKANTADG